MRRLISAALFAGHPDERDVKFAEMEDMLRGLVEARFTRREDDVISRMIDSEIEFRSASQPGEMTVLAGDGAAGTGMRWITGPSGECFASIAVL